MKYGIAAVVAAAAAGGGVAAWQLSRPKPAPTPTPTPAPTPAPTPTPTPAPVEKEPWRIGWIGAYDSDMGKSALRMTEMAVDEINAAGGILGRQLKLVSTDAKEDVEEAIKGYEYLAETVKADVIISSDIDDDTLGWMPRLAEFYIPTFDSWTSAILAINQVRDDYDKYKPYFQLERNDYQGGYNFIIFAKEFLIETMGFTKCALFQEDTAYGHGVAEFTIEELAPATGIEIVDHIVYDVDTPDFSPLYARMERSGADFILQIASVRDLIPAAQYVELGVKLPLFGVIVSAFSAEFWEDTGGRGAGITVSTSLPQCFSKMDEWTRAATDNYQARWPTRPILPHFNAYNCYYTLWMVKEVAEKAEGMSRPAPGEPVDKDIVTAFVEEMERIDFTTGYLDDGFPYVRYKFFKPGEKDPYTDHYSTHGTVYDPKGKEGKAIVWHQWQPDGWAYVFWPERYATGKFMLPEEIAAATT